MTGKMPSKTRIILAFAVSLVADALEFPINGVVATGLFALPAEVADFILDSVVMLIISFLLGFHWVLLPSFLVELVPGIDMFPTWTGCVAWLVWHRKQQAKMAANPPLLDAPPPLP
jgi:hypothetical protein